MHSLARHSARLLPPGDARQERGAETVTSEVVFAVAFWWGPWRVGVPFPPPEPLQPPAGTGDLLFRRSLRREGDGCPRVTRCSGGSCGGRTAAVRGREYCRASRVTEPAASAERQRLRRGRSSPARRAPGQRDGERGLGKPGWRLGSCQQPAGPLCAFERVIL